jgi:hypothetical protein
MKSIGSIMKTSLLMLTISMVYTGYSSVTTPSKLGGNISEASVSKIPTPIQTELRIDTPNYEAGVLVADYLSPLLIYCLIYCLILALRNFARASNVNTNSLTDRTETDQASVIIIGLRLVIPLIAIESKQVAKEQADKNGEAHIACRFDGNRAQPRPEEK